MNTYRRTQSFLLPLPNPGYRISGKEVEARGLGSWHHLQLIQSHVAPSRGPPARVLSSLFLQAKSLLLPKPPEPCGPNSCPSCVVSTPPKPCGPNLCPSHVVISCQSCEVPTYSAKASWFSLGLNPHANLPLQPHFRLLLQSVTPASIPVFFQLYWAAIVSLGRYGPMVWSQSSPSFHSGSVTRGNCFPVTSWV